MRNNKPHLWDNPPPKKVSICGAIETNISTIATNKKTAISTIQQQKFNNQSNCSKSLQMLLDQRPSMLVYLVFLTSTFFLTALMIWVWKGKVVEVARVQGILFSPVELEKYQSVKKGKFVSLNIPEKKQIKLGELMHDNFIVKAQISKQQSILFKKGMPLKIEIETTPTNKSGIIFGKINSIFPDVDSKNKNIFFYQIEVALEQTYPMNKNQYIALHAGQKITTTIKHSYSIAEIFSAKIN